MIEIIGARFRGGPKEYYFDPRGVTVEPGQFIIVETAAGREYARCVTGNHSVEDAAVVKPLRPLVRVATENDKRTWELNRAREKSAFAVCRKKIAAHGLPMKLVKAESNFDGTKIVFSFTSEGRVDFRALVRDLAGELRARIELRQIGVRDEAKLLGGIGICGKPFCCAEFLDGFVPVSIKMAKTQNLSLNPAKISGSCGRLMCCLKYEQNAYEDAARRCPRQDSFVMTPDGPGNITNVDILREQAVVRLDDAPEVPKRYHNSELDILRSGKGSRDGVAIPRERPKRWRPAEDDDTAAGFPAEPSPVPPERADGEDADRKRRSRRSRGHRGSNGAAAPEQAEKRRESGAAPKADGGNAAPRRRHRGGRGRRKGGESRPEA